MINTAKLKQLRLEWPRINLNIGELGTVFVNQRMFTVICMMFVGTTLFFDLAGADMIFSVNTPMVRIVVASAICSPFLAALLIQSILSGFHPVTAVMLIVWPQATFLLAASVIH